MTAKGAPETKARSRPPRIARRHLKTPRIEVPQVSSIYDHPQGEERTLAVLEQRTDRSGECWLWTGSKFPRGYGKFYLGGQQTYAHRASYEAHNGRIADGLMVLHSCDTPGCVNPAHLRAGTHEDNMRDRQERGRNAQTLKTHCPEGHAYDAANTYVRPDGGGRGCRACRREADRKHRAKKGAGK